MAENLVQEKKGYSVYITFKVSVENLKGYITELKQGLAWEDRQG